MKRSVHIVLGEHADGIHRLAKKQQRPVAHILLERIALLNGMEYVPYRANRYTNPAKGADGKGRMIVKTPPELHDAMIRSATKQGLSVQAYVRQVAEAMLG
jgi:predicted HicB family RNase H-like nuclease